MANKNETDCQEEKADKAGQIQNLKTTMQLLLQQYQDFVSRKERVENKALGYLTPLSILLAATVAILIMMTQAEEKDLTYLVFLFFFIGQVHFSIWTLFFALKAYSVKASWYPVIKEHSQYWPMNEACYLGRINNAFVKVIDELDELIKRLVDDVQYCRVFLIFSMICGIFNIITFVIYVFKYFMRG